MPSKGQKRCATEAKKANVQKKTRVGDEANPAIQTIEQVILEAEELPQTCRDMLVKGAHGSLTTPVHARHEVQTMLVRMVEEVIVNRAMALAEELTSTKKAEEAEQKAKEDLLAKLSAAEDVLAEKSRILQEKAVARASTDEKLASNQAALAEAEADQAKVQHTLDVLAKDKACFEAAIEKDLQAIAQGETDGAQTVALLLQYKLDDSLVQALPGTCSRAPAERGTFDTMVMDQLETGLKQKLTEIVASIDAETRAHQERTNSVSAAQAALKEVEADKTKAVDEEAAAETARTEAVSCVEAAKAAVADQEPAVANAVTQREEKAAALDVFQITAAQPFLQLRDFTTDLTEEIAVETAPEAEAAKTMEVEPAADAAVVSVGGA